MKKFLIIAGSVVAMLAIAFFALRAFTKSHSPAATATFEKNGLAVTVEYSQPAKKGRVIFGSLVPYGQVWRTGANEATEITFNRDVVFGVQPVEAGRYAVFTIPQPDRWTIILNRDLGQWGAFTYDDTKDVLRTQVPVQAKPTVTELFTIDLNEATGGADLVLEWDQTRVVVPIR